MHVIGHAPEQFAEVGRIGHQPTSLHIFAPGIHCGQSVFLCLLDDQLAVGEKDTVGIDDDGVRLLLRNFAECVLDCGRGYFLERQTAHRDLQSLACFAKLLSFDSLRNTRGQIGRLGCCGASLLEDLQALSPDLNSRGNSDAGDVAARMRQARGEPGLDRIPADPDNRYRAGLSAGSLCGGIVSGNDYHRIAAHDFTSEIGIPLGPSLARIPVDGEVLSLDIA